MTEAMDISLSRRFGIPRWAMIAFVVPSVILTLFAFGWSMYQAWQFDEERCPFFAVTKPRCDKNICVVEQARTCVSAVQERRWIAEFSNDKVEVGRRRLGSQFFKKGYHWNFDVRGKSVKIQVIAKGARTATFHWPPKQQARSD